MLNLVFLGIQGSGKGTQADLLKTRYGFTHLNVGSLLREKVRQQTGMGKRAEEYLKIGELVPDSDVMSLIGNHIAEETKGLVLDGFPRTLTQADFLETRITLNYAIYFDLSDQEAMKRLSSRRVCRTCQANYNLLIKKPVVEGICDNCGDKLEHRSDDHDAAINLRIKRFHQQTKPVIDFYKKINKLITIDALFTPDQIHQELLQKIGLS